LTGRENVFLNGAILGMTRSEIRRNFDEIVAFSECEAFIDTPVKRYSSGMYVRLAFSVAVEVDPDILLMDEVTAVGDAAFQQKSLDRIQDFRRRGKTIVFVSHAMASVRSYCDRVLLLYRGNIVADGPPDKVIDRYMHLFEEPQPSVVPS
jgi:ABC-type polysaccharide/polyol phosphate transport system ATPase subunit